MKVGEISEPSDFGTFGRYVETPVDRMPADMRDAYEFTRKLRGMVPGPHKIWPANPKLSKAIIPTSAYFQRESTLTKAEIEIVTNVINSRWLAAYSNYEHEIIAKKLGGLPPEKVEALHRLDMRGWTPGTSVMLEPIFMFPREVLALNGCCALSQTTVLAADSFAGAIWRIDFDDEGRAPRAKPWLKHESMAHVKNTLPPPPQPGINGLRYSQRTGFAYYTTTGQKLFMRVRVDPATLEPVGGPERVAGGGMYDDFCIDDGRDRAYLTVHRENRIDSEPLRPGGILRPLAGALLNEMMLGPSSAAWSRAPGEAGQVVYVTTDGGQTAPPPDGVVRTAKVLRMELQQASATAGTA
jgi:hypothetical protein